MSEGKRNGNYIWKPLTNPDTSRVRRDLLETSTYDIFRNAEADIAAFPRLSELRTIPHFQLRTNPAISDEFEINDHGVGDGQIKFRDWFDTNQTALRDLDAIERRNNDSMAQMADSVIDCLLNPNALPNASSTPAAGVPDNLQISRESVASATSTQYSVPVSARFNLLQSGQDDFDIHSREGDSRDSNAFGDA